MDNLFAFLIAAVVLLFFVRRYMKDLKKKEEQARLAAEKGSLRSEGRRPSIRTSTPLTVSVPPPAPPLPRRRRPRHDRG